MIKVVSTIDQHQKKGVKIGYSPKGTVISVARYIDINIKIVYEVFIP